MMSRNHTTDLQTSGSVDPLSLRQRVFRYLENHPAIWEKGKRGQNSELYETFEAEGESAQNVIRSLKAEYLDLLDPLLNPRVGGSGKDRVKKKVSQIKIKDGVFDKFALNPGKVKIWEIEDRDLKDLFIKFVGFVGRYSDEINPNDPERLGYALLDSGGEIHRGEALPEPIDEITDEYMGIQEYQADAIITYRDSTNLLDIWARGFGKTWKAAWVIQISMKYEADKFLYFSLTDVAYIVANWVYLWADSNDAIIQNSVEKIKHKKKLTGRKDSYQKFSLINGARLEVHGITSSKTLGFHGWIIIFDDIIDISHKRLPTKQRDLERAWNSRYSKIRRKKFIMENTRKFEGDFFDSMIEQFEKKGKEFKKRKGYLPDKYKLCIDLKTPYTKLAYKGDVAGYRKFIEDMNADRIQYSTENILAPWYEPDDFEIMKLEDWEAFNAEMLGNPRALEGGMVKPSDILYVQRPHFADGVQMGGCGVDCASTEDEDNDYTAVESCLMSSILNKEKKRLEKRFTFWKSDVSRMLARNHVVENINDPYDWINDKGQRIKRGIFETVQLHLEDHRHYYPGVKYIIAWERNNAGIALMEQAIRAYDMKEEVEIRKGEYVLLDFPRFFVPDPNQAVKWKKGRKSNVRLGITSIQDKVTRIYGELKHSIEVTESRFTFNMEDTVGMMQLLAYPKGKHDDSPDARGMIKDELKRRWKAVKLRKRTRDTKAEKRLKENVSKEWVRMSEPWRAQQNALRHRHKRNRRLGV